MSISGSQLYRKISGVRSQIETEIGAKTSSSLALGRESQNLLVKQSELWSSLAAIHLDLGFNLPKEIQSLIEKRKGRLENQQDIVADGEKKISELTKVHKERENELRAAQAAFDEHEKTLASAFESDADVVSLRQDVVARANALNEFKAKLARSAEESSTKSASYEADELFMYLRRRAYGEEGYHASGIVERLDRWIARLIGYDRARLDYERLQKNPEWNRARVEKATADHGDLAARLKKIEDEAFKTLAPFKDKLRVAGKALDAAADDISRQHAIISTAQRTLSDASLAQDEDLKRITSELAKALERVDIRSLEDLARRTESKEDDLIVRDIIRNRNDIADLNSQSNVLAREIASLKARAAEYEAIETKMKRKDWHHSDHSFEGNMDSLIGNMAIGVITSDLIWQTMQNSHVAPRPTYQESVRTSPWSSGSSSSSSSSSSGSSGDWGSSSSNTSDYSTGGGGGGGDYSTGGGG